MFSVQYPGFIMISVMNLAIGQKILQPGDVSKCRFAAQPDSLRPMVYRHKTDGFLGGVL